MAVFSCNGRRILFIHVPKCAGTSVSAMLEAVGEKRFDAPFSIGGRRLRPRHLARQELEQIFTADMFDYAFMVVRSPIARIVSEYRYQCRKSGIRWQKHLGFDNWLRFSLAWAASRPSYRENHFRPQVDFRAFGCEVFRLEDGLGPVAARVSELIEMEVSAPVTLNASAGANVTISGSALRTIESAYAPDFTAFGYRSRDPDLTEPSSIS